MRKYLIVIVMAFVVILFGPKLLSPGSYSDAEKFELPINQIKLISLIENFKEQNPKYKVPSYVGLSDGRHNSKDHWYHIYFYYPEENQIIYTWLREEETQKTILAFVSVNNGLKLGEWRDINKDFSASENKDQLEKFEQRILNTLRDGIN